MAAMHHEMGKRKVPKNTTELPEKLTLISDDIQGSFKKQKRAQSAGTLDCEGFLTVDSCSSEEGRNVESGKPDNNESLASAKSQSESSSDKFSCALSVPGQGIEDSARCKKQGISHCAEAPVLKEWKPLEKELYLKGVEIVGRNR